jgi:hypothetical protein
VSGEFDLKLGREPTLGQHQLLEVILWHQRYGLQVGFSRTPPAIAAATLNGDAFALMTEILRLAELGLRTQIQARDVAGVCMHLVVEADAEWKRRFR